MTTHPVFVPVALPLDEARALFGAARSVFASLTALGEVAEHGGELARGMYRLAQAIDERMDQIPEDAP